MRYSRRFCNFAIMNLTKNSLTSRQCGSAEYKFLSYMTFAGIVITGASLFTKLPWPGDSKETLIRSWSQWKKNEIKTLIHFCYRTQSIIMRAQTTRAGKNHQTKAIKRGSLDWFILVESPCIHCYNFTKPSETRLAMKKICRLLISGKILLSNVYFIRTCCFKKL